MKLKRLYQITWIDADIMQGTWQSADRVRKHTRSITKVFTAGWLVHKSRRYITLAAALGYGPDVGLVMRIPRACILHAKQLGVRK